MARNTLSRSMSSKAKSTAGNSSPRVAGRTARSKKSVKLNHKGSVKPSEGLRGKSIPTRAVKKVQTERKVGFARLRMVA